MRTNRSAEGGTWSIAAVGAAMIVVACGSEGPSESVSTVSSEIINGTPVQTNYPPWNPGTVAVYHSYVRPCSGTLIRKQWVLTARHCIVVDGNVTFGPIMSLSGVKVAWALSPGLTPPAGASQAVAIIASDTVDVALIKISPEIPPAVGLPAPLSNVPFPPLGTLLVMGYGRSVDGGDDTVENGTTGAGTLRMANLSVQSFDSTFGTFALATNSSGQRTWHGDSGGPSYTTTDRLGRAISGVAGIHRNPQTDVAVLSNRRWIKQMMYSRGSYFGNPSADIVMAGGTSWNTIPLLHRLDTEDPPYFQETNPVVPNFPVWARTAGAKLVMGDFNGDRRGDLALIGGSGWTSVPVATASGASYSVTNVSNSALASVSQLANTRVTTGDFDGDGKTDIALMHGTSAVVTLARSQGNGAFTSSTLDLSYNFPFTQSAAGPGTTLMSGDFDGDALDDLAVIGGSPTRVAIAFSNSATFDIEEDGSGIGLWVTTPGAKSVVGDFDGDGLDDIAVTGGSGWTDIRVGFSLGYGGFRLAQFPGANFPAWSRTTGVRMVSGDYDGDGVDDIALVGGVGWSTVPIAFGHKTGFGITNESTQFASWAQQSGPIKIVSGR